MFKPQKVLELSKELAKKNPNLSGLYYLTPKIDGWYVYIHYSTKYGWEVPRSSTERPIPSLQFLQEELRQVSLDRDCTLIAEAVVPNTPFHILNGMLNRSVGNCACTDVVLYVHDMLIKENINAATRLKLLLQLNLPSKSDRFRYLEGITTVFGEKVWKNYFDSIVEEGGEGIVAKRLDGFYAFGKRNSDLLKMKLACERDLLCEQVVQEVGEKGNPSTSLILLNKQNVRTKVVVNSHEILAMLEDANVVGNVVTVKAMEELENGVLRQPVFSCFRFDKHAGDID